MLKWATKSYSECCIKHECLKSQVVTPPKLLVEVHEGLRLVDTSQLVGQIEYVALSYCWGPSSSLKTTSSNIDTLKEEIAASSLPALLRDVVLLVTRLGIQYLWVDRLCIIQGHDQMARDDWASQCSQMADIYRNAALTVCASGSDDCRSGLIRPICAQIRAEQPSTFGEQDDPFSLLLAPIVPEQDSTVISLREPLNSRAWTLQEYSLSSRILFFGMDQLLWYCSETFVASRDGHRRNDLRCDRNQETFFHLRFADYSKISKSSNENSQLWKFLVTGYSSRFASYESDKLSAISGLARLLSSGIGGKYWAGIWEKDLTDLLCVAYGTRYDPYFTLELRRLKPKRTTKYRAPTWSWACLDGNISFNYSSHIPRALKWDFLQEQVVAKVVECSVQLLGKDPFGSVTAAHIKLRTPLLRAKLHDTGNYCAEQGELRYPTARLMADRDGNDDSVIAMLYLDEDDLFDRPGGQQLPLWCAQVVGISSDNEAVSVDACGILLRAVDAVDNCYERIGMATSHGAWPQAATSNIFLL